MSATDEGNIENWKAMELRQEIYKMSAKIASLERVLEAARKIVDVEDCVTIDFAKRYYIMKQLISDYDRDFGKEGK